jgi:hypothetical protein
MIQFIILTGAFMNGSNGTTTFKLSGWYYFTFIATS